MARMMKKSTQNLIIAVGLLFLIGFIANQTGVIEGFTSSDSNTQTIQGYVPDHVQGVKKKRYST